jgi:hypothetical protein
VLPRLRSQPGVLVAVLASIAVAATLLAAGPVLATAVAEGGLRADLAGADPATIGVEVEVRTSATQVSEVVTTLEDVLVAQLGEFAAPPDVLVTAGTVRLQGQPADVVTPLAVADVGGERALLEPVQTGGATGAALPVQLHEDAATALDVAPGDVLETLDGARVQVTGTVAPVDPTDRRWWGEPFGRDGVVPGVDFTAVGPLYVAEAADLAVLLGDDPAVAVRARTLPVLEEVTPATLVQLAERASALEDRVDLAFEGRDVAERWQVRTPLAGAASAATVSLAATRAAVVATVGQVAVLAIYTLGLAGRLLRSGREVETMLLRARGATPEQLGRVAVLEGVVLVVPAVLAAPLLAALAVEALGAIGVTAGSTLTLAPSASPAALGAAALAGVACLVVLVVPAVASARRTYASARETRGRRDPVGVVQSLGLDLALAAVAGLGIWQLRSAGAPVGGRAPVGPGDVDPVLVVAPALGLLAGALLVLRLVPAVARGGELLADRVRGLVAGLSGWQVARRPDAVARPTLLLVLGVAVGVLAATYGTTWGVSQADQAEVAVGADVVVEPDRRVTALPDWRTASVLAAEEEVARVRPVWEGPVSLVAGDPGGTLFAVDAATPVLAGRPDTRPSVPMGTLDVPPLQGLTLPAGAVLEVATELAPDPSWPDQSVGLTFVVRDGHGLTHLLEDRTAPVGPAVHEWSLEGVTMPVDLIALQVDTTAGRLDGVGYAGPPLGDGATPPPPALDLLVGVPVVDGQSAPLTDGWVTDPYTSLAAFPAAHRDTTVTADGWRVRATTGVAGPRGRRATLTVVHEDAAVPGDAAVPAVVHPDVLTATGRDVGEDLLVATGGSPLRLAIAGTLPLVPGAVDARQPLLVDLDAVAAARWTAGRDLTQPLAWYVELDEQLPAGPLETSQRLADAWSAPPVDAPSVHAAAADEAERRGDPIAVGLVAALTLGALAAAALAVLGTVTTAVVGVRERAAEFALLQAVGTSLRQLRWWLAAEIALVVTVGLVAGGLLGAVLVWAVLPTIALAADGSLAVPAPVVVVPLQQLVVAAVVVVGAFTLVPVVLTRVVARAHVAEVLRLGEDT